MGEGLLTRRFSSLSRPPERVNLPQSAGKDLDIPINDLLVGKIRFALVDLAPGDDRFLFPWIDTNRERLKEAKITLFVLSTITSDHYSHRVFSAVSKRLTEQEKLFVARYYRDPHEDLSAFSQTENPCAARASKFDISARRIETYTYIERYSTVPVLAARVQNTMDVEDLLKRGRVITTHRREMESLGKDLGGALGF
ncbi:MAG: hypothetical protein JJT96_15035 [Opitutales bacterium]|nr:hypothetical protein [Opitutales bacterium]